MSWSRFGSDYGHINYAYVTPVIIMVILILLVWRIGFGMTGSGTCRRDAGGSRLLSGAILEACG
jgi:surface polysaccharide O-acyltransferase-like enzyme